MVIETVCCEMHTPPSMIPRKIRHWERDTTVCSDTAWRAERPMGVLRCRHHLRAYSVSFELTVYQSMEYKSLAGSNRLDG